jgi:two-component system, OmpR family, phosphate regulon sensor histidine kinase PhoR
LIWLGAVCAILAGVSVYLFLVLSREKRKSDAHAAELRDGAAKLAAQAANYQQKLRALSDISAAGILMLNERGSVLHANTTAERLFNTTSEGVVGHSLIQATLSSDLQEFVLTASSLAQPRTRDFQMPGAHGRILRASLYPPTVGLSGAPESMLVVVDVTELRRLETIRRDFVANVSHELRTPLASIRAMAETLHEGALDDKEVADKFLSTIVQEADRLARISEDLLILSDAESKPAEKTDVDLAALAQAVVHRFLSQGHESGLTLTLDTEGPVMLHASQDQMEQVVINLVSNALRYTPRGGSVSVHTKKLGAAVMLQVSDTGIGIMQEDLPRIFERFYRVDKARSRASGGTGLGLSIVKNIVEAHGGEVRVTSEYNHGSTFTVIIPSAEEQA